MNNPHASQLTAASNVTIPSQVEGNSDLEGSLDSASPTVVKPGSKYLKPAEIINLQRTIGNQAVLRMINANSIKTPGAYQKRSGLSSYSSKAKPIIQRLPTKIDPSSIVNYKQFSDSTSTNAVFMVEFKDGGKIVVKYQGAKATSGEILAGKILEHQKIPGINVPEYRVLETGEVDAIRNKLIELAKSKNDAVALKEIDTRMSSKSYNMLAMDMMENAGMLAKEDKEQIYAKNGKLTPEGLERLRNIGKLYAFQYFVKGSDRFKTAHSDLGNAQDGNSGNLMMSGQTTSVQAIDTTLDMGFHRYGGKPEKKKAYLDTLSDHIDELIFNTSGNDKLTKALESFMKIDEIDDNGRQVLRAGFLDGLKLLAQSTADIDQMVGDTLSMLPKDSDTDFSEEVVRSSFTELLTNTQNLFSEKAELLEQVDSISKDEEVTIKKDVLNILKIASTVKVNGELDQSDVGFLKARSKGPNSKDKKRKTQWPNDLKALESAKNGLKKGKLALAELSKELMEKIVNYGRSLLDLGNAILSGDFLRICSKMILRSLGIKY